MTRLILPDGINSFSHNKRTEGCEELYVRPLKFGRKKTLPFRGWSLSMVRGALDLIVYRVPLDGGGANFGEFSLFFFNPQRVVLICKPFKHNQLKAFRKKSLSEILHLYIHF